MNFGKNATTYLRELHEKLEIAKSYAASHAEREQNRFAARYNFHSRDKRFDVGERVLELMPDSTSSRMFSKWSGPGIVVLSLKFVHRTAILLMLMECTNIFMQTRCVNFMTTQNSGGFDQAKAVSPKALPPKFNGNSQLQ